MNTLKSILSLRTLIILFALLAITSYQKAHAQCGSASVLMPTASKNTVCSGNSITVSLPHANVIRWIYRDHNGPWIPLVSSSMAVFTHTVNFTIPGMRDYRAVISHSGCTSDTSATVTIGLTANGFGNNNVIIPSASKDTVCTGTTVTFFAPSQNMPHSWIYRDSISGNWQVFATGNRYSVNMSANTNGALTRSVRLLVYRSGTCMIDTSAERRVIFRGYTKKKRADVVAISSRDEVCNGSLVGVTIPSVFRINSWHFRDNGGAWQNLTSTSPSISQNASSTTSVTREYVAVLSDSTFCTADTSSSAFVQIKIHVPASDTLQRPMVSSSTVCSGSGIVLSGNSNTRAWLRSNSSAGPWTAFNGFVSTLTDTQTHVSLPSKRYYRMLNLNAINCTDDSSGIVEVNIRPNIHGYSKTKTTCVGDTLFCSGERVNIISYSSQDRCLFASNANGPWTLLPSLTDTNTTVNNFINRFYRLLRRDNENCAIDTFSPMQISIRPKLYNGTTVKIMPYADSATVCAGRPINVSQNPSYSGYIIDRWIFSQNNGAFINVPSSTDALAISQNTNGVVSNTLRTYRMLLYNLNTCIVDTSLAVNVNIEAQKYGTVYTALPYSSRSRVCSGTGPVSVNITPPSGYRVLGWMWRNNSSGNWILVNNSASPSYIDNNTNVTVNTLRNYRALLYNPYLCQTDTSAELVIPIVTRQGGVSNRLVPTTASNVVCSGSSFTASFTPDINTNIQQWIWKSENGSWNTVSTGSGMFNNSFQVVNSVQHEIRVVYVSQSNENCTADTSLPLTIQVVPLRGGIVTNVVPTISLEGRICAGELIRVNNNTTGFYAWMTKDIAGWVFPQNARDRNMTDSNTQVSNPLQREYRFIYLRAGGVCAVDTSQSVYARIFPIGNSTSGGLAPILTQTVCAGNPINLTAGMQPFESIVNWQYRKDNGFWNSLGVAASDINTMVAKHEVRHYRIIRQNRGNCSFDTSASTSVYIKAYEYANNNTLTPLTTTTACRLSSQVVSIIPPTNSFIEYWLIRTNQSPWVLANTSNLTQQNFDNSKLPANALSVSYRAVLRNTNSCSLDSTGSLTLNIKNPIYGNISTAPTGKPITCATSSSIAVTLNIPSGYQLSKWMYKPNEDTSWQNYAFTSSTLLGVNQINDPQINITHESTRSYRALLTNASRCTIDSTSIFNTVILHQKGRSVPNWIPVAEKSTVCSSQPAKIFTPTNATATYWIYKEDNGPLKLHPFSQSGTLTDYMNQITENQTRTYYSIQKSETYCRTDTSAGVDVRFIANSVGGYSTIATESNFTSNVCEGSYVRLGLSNMSLLSNVQQWIYKEGNGPWVSVTREHAAPYTSTNLTREYRSILLNTSLQCKLDTTLALSLTFNSYKYGRDSSLIAHAPDTSCDGAGVGVTLSKSTLRSGWLFNDQNSSWKHIPEVSGNAIFDTYTSVSQPVLRTYVAVIKDEAKCSIDTSMAKNVRLLPRGGRTQTQIKVTTADTVCLLSSSVFASVNSANVSHWIYRDNFAGPWNRIPFSNDSTIIHNTGITSVSIIREYKAVLNQGLSCNEDTSVSDTVIIRGTQHGIVSGLAPTTNAATYCSGDVITIGFPMLPSQYRFSRMLVRDNNGTWRVWRDIGLTDRSTHVTSTTTRSYRLILLNTQTCREDSTQIVNVTINPMNFGNSTTMVSSSNSNVCSGVSVTLNTNPGSGRSMIGWLYRNNAVHPWEILPGTFSGVTDQNTFTSVSVTRQYRALFYTSAVCRIDSSSIASVNINAFSKGTNSSFIPIVTGASCAESYNTISISPGSNTIRNWILSENSSPWFVVRNSQSNNFTDYHTGISTPATRSYAALLISTSTCSIDTSAIRTLNINSISRGNTNVITFNAPSSVCAGTNYNVSVNLASFPAGFLPKRWIYRDNGGIWNTIETPSLIINDANTHVTVNTTREYRFIILQTSICREDTSNAVSVNINTRSAGTDLSISPTGPNNICRGASANVAFNPGTGNFIHEWLYRTNVFSSWVKVAGNTSTPLLQTPESDTSINQIQYRVVIRKNTTCALDTSGTHTLNILSPVPGSSTTLSPQTFNSNVCSRDRVNLFFNSSTIQSWIYSNNNGPWRELYFGNVSSVSDEPIVSTSSTRTYKVLYQNTTTCRIDTSSGVNVTVNSPGIFNSVLASPTTLKSSICSKDSVQLRSGVSGSSSVLLWQFRNASGSWQNKKETGVNITEYETETNNFINRNYRMVVFNPSSCRIDTSSIATISINTIGAGNIAITPSSSDSSICSGSPVVLSLPISYVVDGWLYRDNSTGQWLTVGAGVNSINDLNTVTSQQIIRSYRAIVRQSNSCGRDTTEIRQVIIRPISRGNFAHIPVATSDIVCTGNNVQISLIQSGGIVQSWLYRNNQIGNWLHIPWTSATLIDTATTVSSPLIRSYRAVTFFKNTCTIDTSAEKTIDIKPIIRTSVIQQPTSSSTSICSGQPIKILYPTVSPVRIDRWLFRNGNSGNWTVFTTSYIDSISDNNTTVSNSVVRNYRAVTFTPQQCRFDTSAERGITINVFSYGNDNSVKPSAVKDTVCKNGSVTLTANPSLQLEGWLYNDGPTVHWTKINQTASTFTDLSTSSNLTGIRRYRILFKRTTGCVVDTSDAKAVVLVTPTNIRNNQIVPSPVNSFICSGNFISVSVSGKVLHWIYRDNGVGNWNITEAGKNTMIMNNTNVTQRTIRNICAIVENSNKCGYDTTATVNIVINVFKSFNNNILPDAQPASICSGNEVKLSINGYEGNITHWLYRDNGGTWFILPVSSDSLVQRLTNPGSREYKVWLYTGCFTDSTLTRSVNVYPTPQSATIFRIGDSLLTMDTSGVTYEWYLNGTAIPNSNVSRIKPPQNGNYSVKLTNGLGCFSTSSNYSFIYTDVHQRVKQFALIYPNPTSGELHIELPEQQENIQVTILSGVGKVMQESTHSATSSVKLQLGNLPKGMYMIKVNANGKQHVERIILH